LRPECGAVASFAGVVRNHSQGRATRYLEYEAYESMALKTMQRLGCELAARLPIDRIAMVHRLGRLEIGETSVAIVVTAAHRRAALEACGAAIDRLKRTVPVWKKEYFEDGEAWVEGAWDASLLGL
jgi:molybdopterin synthase catalytic subunit